MKNRFTLVDVIAATTELKKLQGMRVNNVYDIDNKTYLIKLTRPDEKAVILFESGVRLHQTFHDWPKSQTPSSFSMKLRKHINQKRLTSIRVVGFDRIVELIFGTEDRENRLYVELYDRGNVILTDHEMTILNILRVRTDKDTSVRWAVREKYTFSGDAEQQDPRGFKSDDVIQRIQSIPDGKDEQLGRILSGFTKCGNPITKEILSKIGLKWEQKLNAKSDLAEISAKFEEIQKATEEIWDTVEHDPKGFISYSEIPSATSSTPIEIYSEFNPISMPLTSKLQKELRSFCESVDEFYSRIETQKQEQKAVNMEKQALKKLENVEKDQKGRIEALQLTQEQREHMANRIILNQELVEKALLLIRSALANQFSWQTIEEMRKSAAANGDPVAKSIDSFKFENNEFFMKLGDPYDEEAELLKVPIDISMNASKNAQRHFVDKKSAAEKVKKTVASSEKAIKNAQEKAKCTLEQVKIVTEVKKSRKTMWFEKFRWFISSEGYIVVAGRDAQQNELLVKKYLRPNDIYMHADVRGASSVIIRNKSFEESMEIPPKTLTEAAQMAVCYSNAWEATVTASAWWVHPSQVTRTAPTGEYLPSGSFMIRGKKNFMPPSQLVMGLGILFRMDEESIERHVALEKEKRKEEEPAAENAENEPKLPEKEPEIAPEDVEFPDVQIQIGKEAEEVFLIDIGPKNAPKTLKNVPKTAEKSTKTYLEEKCQKEQVLAGPSAKTQKRKQRKEKMVKQKYKDQTDDDLELHKELLKPHGKLGKLEEENVEKQEKIQEKPPKIENFEPKTAQKEAAPKAENADEEEPEEEDDKEANAEEQSILSSLTAQPLDEDTLLFAVPVVAPYSALSTYKYRVKVTPGIGKRGKATKQAIELFTRQKTDRQAALIKSLLSDDSASRNLPTKIRISAPQLHAK
ncbi:hypothetical protein L5515_003267 [Caenorhabditis briggsae]|uniref:Uncharacterized protein n=1 Tax=Caenorhabditis briggsae TaxID=6238 RepID=A0AAE9JBA1_CAEBR|nr:hypothetical protein L5515_003267 [Caenorhabditis briggsae]